MKLGIVFIVVGTLLFIALVVMLVMNLIIGDYASAVWGTIYTSVAGGFWLYFGIKRINKAKE